MVRGMKDKVLEDILPYLTVEQLSEDEITDLANLANDVIAARISNDPLFSIMVEHTVDSIAEGQKIDNRITPKMAEARNGRFNKLCNTLSGVSEELRPKLAESFLAADFGEDFGDALLNIAGSERLGNGEKEAILDTINSCRESIGKIVFGGIIGDRVTGFVYSPKGCEF